MKGISESNLKGIDVSHWDGNIDYSKVKSQGIEIVYIKATQGENIVDSKFEINTKNAKEKGLNIGFYHFFKPSTEESAKKQAEHFVNTTKKYKCDCKMALDIEVDGGLSSSSIRKVCKVFLEEVKKLSGLDVVIYSYTSFVKEHFDKSLSTYSLWIAQYGVKAPSDNGIWDNWVGFQYSEKGSVRGISTQCDLDAFTDGI
ncbi:MAG: GH25 family lysozyme, partial [Peptostreptococcaceae bacterium]